MLVTNPVIGMNLSLGFRVHHKQNWWSHGGWVTPAVNQHPLVHHQGWMICDQEKDICWVPIP
jgi:hypothetical protein